MKYKSIVFRDGDHRVRISYRRRHWFFRWQLMGVEVWTPTFDNAYAYGVYKNG